MSGNGHDVPQIDIERFGPGPEVIDEVSRAVLSHPSVQEQLGEARHRLPPDRYRATIYDYTNNRVVLVTGCLEDVRGSTEVSEAGHQPLPNREEFDEAIEVLLEDDDLGPAIREQRLVPYRPMPPLVEAELPDGRVERTLAVGLLSQGDEACHEIVGANMVNRTVSRFDGGWDERRPGNPTLTIARTDHSRVRYGLRKLSGRRDIPPKTRGSPRERVAGRLVPLRQPVALSR